MSSITIIVCCYNSSSRIPTTLEYISNLEIPIGHKLSLLIVDNNSTDGTGKLVSSKWKELGSPFELKVVHENTPGLGYARRTGVHNSDSTYGLFCDDDNWLEKDYLIKGLEIFNLHSEIGLIGGAGSGISNTKFPPWFFNKSNSFAVGVQSFKNGDITHRKYLWGAGLFFRLNILKKIYSRLTPLVLGRTGLQLTSGDDGEICAWYIMAGYRLHYTNNLKFTHFIDQVRLTDEYYNKFFHQKTSLFWLVYSKYLTVRFFLFQRNVISLKNLLFNFYVLNRDLFFLVLNYKKSIKIIKIHRIIKSIKIEE